MDAVSRTPQSIVGEMPPGCVFEEESSQIDDDHGGRSVDRHEASRIWRNPALQGVELFQGVYTKYEFARHFHSVPAVGLVDRGSMRTYCRRANHLVPEGTVLLLNAGEVHAPGPADHEGWSFRIFFFDDAFFGERSAHQVWNTLRFSQPFVQDDLLAKTLLSLHRRLEGRAVTLEAETLMHHVLEQLSQKHVCEHRPSQSSAAGKNAIRRVREHLNTFYSRDITLADMADVAGLSTSQVLRSFRQTVGITPHAYLIQARIEAATNLLRFGNAISDVADATGFADQSHFTRHFKRIMGVAPGRYLSGASLRAS